MHCEYVEKEKWILFYRNGWNLLRNFLILNEMKSLLAQQY